jgi:hypothetical protein
MISFNYYKDYGIEYCFGRATVHNFLGLTIKTFYGDCKADAVAKAEKFIDNLYNY